MFVRSFIESVVCTIKDVPYASYIQLLDGTLSSHMKFYTQLYHEQQFNERIWALRTNKTSASLNHCHRQPYIYANQTHQYPNSFFSCTENIFFIHFLCNAKWYLIEIYTYGYLCCCIRIRTSTTTEEKRSIFSFHLCNHFTIEETKQCRHT